MEMTAFGTWGSNGIQTAFLSLGSPDVGSMLGVDNVFIKAVGHDFTRIASRQTLWIPTIETRDFSNHA
jgi:hypothetical protein